VVRCGPKLSRMIADACARGRASGRTAGRRGTRRGVFARLDVPVGPVSAQVVGGEHVPDAVRSLEGRSSPPPGVSQGLCKAGANGASCLQHKRRRSHSSELALRRRRAARRAAGAPVEERGTGTACERGGGRGGAPLRHYEGEYLATRQPAGVECCDPRSIADRIAIRLGVVGECCETRAGNPPRHPAPATRPAIPCRQPPPRVTRGSRPEPARGRPRSRAGAPQAGTAVPGFRAPGAPRAAARSRDPRPSCAAHAQPDRVRPPSRWGSVALPT